MLVNPEEQEPEHWWGYSGPLEGEKQTSARAEVRAILIALEHATGDIELWTDHQAAVRVFQGGHRSMEQAKQGPNGDLWQRIDGLLQASPFRFACLWVNSHANDPWDKNPMIPEAIYKGNEMADKLADKGIKSHRVSKQAADQYQEHQDKAIAVLRRLVTIAAGIHQRYPQQQRREKVQRGPRKGHEERRAETIQALAQTPHAVIKLAGGAWHCTRCLCRSPSARPAGLAWLASACGGRRHWGAAAWVG